MNKLAVYTWLFKTLYPDKHLTLLEIEDLWHESDYSPSPTAKLTRKTLNHWRQMVLQLFGVDIISKREGTKHCYSFSNSVKADTDLSLWLQQSMLLNASLQECRTMTDRIMLDAPPASAGLALSTYTEAMKRGVRLRLVYHRFGEPSPRAPELIEPLGLRCFARRWYAVVHYVKDEAQQRKVICFDRVIELALTDEAFKVPTDFSVQDYFAQDYGVGTGFGEKPTMIVLRVAKNQRPYLSALPLHPTQEEAERHADYSIFTLYMKPTADLARAILPFAHEIRVVRPDSLRELLCSMAKRALENNCLEEEENK